MTAKDQPDELAGGATLVAEPEHQLSRADPETHGDYGATLVAGRYRILNLLGRGGMGAVYRARDTELDEVVALKMLKSDNDAGSDVLERFRREVKLARRVTHPNVARTFDIGEHAGAKFLTMEFVEGEPLSELVRRSGRLSTGRVLEIAAALCAGLGAAHQVGVVHRDLKPDNVLIARDGRVVITDFGIARDPGSPSGTSTVGIVGTPAYMAPEQVEARSDIDARADIYALGVMLYELSTGDLPWKGASAYTVAAARLYSPPPDPKSVRADLLPALAAVILRCMAKEPSDRFPNADEVARALGEADPTMASGSSKRKLAANPEPKQADPRANEKAVAVLPFRNLGAESDEYVADGITDDLIDALSMTAGLRVRPRGAVVRFKGVDEDPREIGRQLGVDVVVEGTVRRSETNMRLIARLTSVEDGFQLWAQRFDRPANDILVVSDESARAIAQALTLHTRAPQRVALTDAVAVDLYLRARAELRLYWPPHINTAVELFTAAYRRAPDDPSIVSGYARACAREWFFSGGASSDVANDARRLANRAVELWPDSADAALALASVRWMEGAPAASAEICRRALDLAPDLPEGLEMLGRFLAEAGRPELAIPRLIESMRLEPNLGAPRQELVRCHALLGDYAEALRVLDQAPDAHHLKVNETVVRARLALWDERVAASLATVVIPEDAPEDSPWFFVRLVRAIVNQQPPHDYLARLDALSQHSQRSPRFRALFLQISAEYRAYTHDHETALDLIESAASTGLFDVSWMDHCPLLEPLRNEPRFVAAHEVVAKRARMVLDALRIA